MNSEAEVILPGTYKKSVYEKF